MNTKCYQLRLHGLREATGHIKATTLNRVVEALLKMTERATRLSATGEGSGRGKKPAWLQEAADFTITGLHTGSTSLEIEALSLRDTAYEVFASQDFWPQENERRPLSLDDTGIDLASLAIQEAEKKDPAGDRFDSSVLQAILDLGTAAGIAGVRYEMISRTTTYGNFVLDNSACARIEERLKNIPPSRAFIVCGRLDRIEHHAGRFRLIVNGDSFLLGRLVRESLDVESLRSLWGEQTTIEGMVHFKNNGHPRLIEARKIRKRMEGDTVFEEMPSAEIPTTRGLTVAEEREARSADFMRLWGAWPGDEPIDELLAQLD